MSDNIPIEIQVEIMKRLPVKSLIQFRSVSKSWKSLIDSSEFVAEYHTQMQHIFVRHTDLPDLKPRYVSIVDDNTFPRQRVSLTPPLPLLVNVHKYCYSIIGCSHGLLCFYCNNYPTSKTGKVVLWNPSIRRAVDVIVPNVANDETYETVLGFGLCRETNDPKIVKIKHVVCWDDMESVSCINQQVEVFTLSTGAWRSLDSSSNLPRKTILFDFHPELNSFSVVIDGVLYWFATYRITMDGEHRPYDLIVSFDFKSEVFGEVSLPNRLQHQRSNHAIFISKLRESLLVLESVHEPNIMVYDVWMMEGGSIQNSLFTKLYTFSVTTRPH